jgi:hypothetical protein
VDSGLEERRIRVNAISLGPTTTPGLVALTNSDDEWRVFEARLAAQVPMRSAVTPPPVPGSRMRAAAVRVTTASDVAAYTRVPSLAMPHCTPPWIPPLATRECHTTFPRLSGSNAQTIPDFWPARSSSRPPIVVTRIAGEPKS